MSYRVFARKYRPQTFTEILGQGPIVTTLANAIRQRRIGQAYLFCGPRGTGKTSLARIFAKALNCVEGPTATPCLSCQRCQEVAQGNSLDVLEIDGASNRGIDQIRSLRELAKFTPAAGAYKVYIIDEVHQITAEGFNALLKTLEEPPPHLLFILATTAPHKVPATILSRCQRYDFKRLGLEVITAKVKSIGTEEKIQISEEAVLGIARAAAGSLRDAESILDQVAAFTEGAIRAEDVRTLLGTIDEDTYAEVVNGILERDPVRLLGIVAQAANAGADLIQWTIGFLGFLRNLLVAKVGAGPLGFEDLGAESIQRLTALAQKVRMEELSVIVQIVTSAVETMRRVGDPRIPLEVALVRLSSADSMVAVAELVDRLEQLEQRLKGAAEEGQEEQKGPVTPSSPVFPISPHSPLTLEQLQVLWPTFLEQLHQQKASTAAYLNEAGPVAVQPGDPPQVVIGFPKGFEFHQKALDHPQPKQMIEQTLGEMLGHPIRCLFQTVEKLPEKAAAVPSDPVPPPADAKPPPILNSVLEMFEGRILPAKGDRSWRD